MFSLMPFGREKRAARALAPRELAPLDLLRQEFASLFDRAFGGWPLPFEVPWDYVPTYGLDMEEKDGAVIVRAEVPGFEPGELDIRILDNLLTIVAEHKEKPPEKGKEPVDHRYGRMERTVTLPPSILVDKVEACYRNGVLEVKLPLAPEVQPKRIEVKT
jgi:HSP20 family protein